MAGSAYSLRCVEDVEGRHPSGSDLRAAGAHGGVGALSALHPRVRFRAVLYSHRPGALRHSRDHLPDSDCSARSLLGIVAAQRSEAGESRYWVLIAVANALLGACELMLDLVARDHLAGRASTADVAVPAHASHHRQSASLSCAAHDAPATPSRLLTRARIWLDVVASALMTYAVILVVYARPIMTPVHPPVAAVLVGAGYALAACHDAVRHARQHRWLQDGASGAVGRC